MTTTVYYPRIESLNFYDEQGLVSGGMTGSMARKKFVNMVKNGILPRISLRKKVITKL